MADSPANKAKDKIDVSYIAGLARLTLDEKEAVTFQGQLEQIVNYIKEVQHLDVSGVEPTAQVVRQPNALRKDVVQPGLARSAVLANAPRHDGEQFLVPKII